MFTKSDLRFLKLFLRVKQSPGGYCWSTSTVTVRQRSRGCGCAQHRELLLLCLPGLQPWVFWSQKLPPAHNCSATPRAQPPSTWKIPLHILELHNSLWQPVTQFINWTGENSTCFKPCCLLGLCCSYFWPESRVGSGCVPLHISSCHTDVIHTQVAFQSQVPRTNKPPHTGPFRGWWKTKKTEASSSSFGCSWVYLQSVLLTCMWTVQGFVVANSGMKLGTENILPPQHLRREKGSNELSHQN